MGNTATFKHPSTGPEFRPLSLGVELRWPIIRDGDLPGFGQTDRVWRLVPQALHWGSNGDHSTLALRLTLGEPDSSHPRIRPEDAHDKIGSGVEVVLYNETPGDQALTPKRTEWFRGHVAQEHPTAQANPDFEGYSVTAYGPELRLAGEAVHGQWIRTIARDDLEVAGSEDNTTSRRTGACQSDLPAIFNRGGLPNASDTDFRLATAWDAAADHTKHNKCRVFDASGRKVMGGSTDPVVAAVHWTAYTALRSVIEWVDDYTVISPATDWAAIEALLGSVVIGEVVAEGRSVLDCLKAILLPVGFGFALMPAADYNKAGEEADEKYRHLLYVFSLHDPQAAPFLPRMARLASPQVSISSDEGHNAVVQRVDFVRDLHHVANDIRVIGDQRRRHVILTYAPTDYPPDLYHKWSNTTYPLTTWDDGGGNILPEDTTSQANRKIFLERYNASGKSHAAYADIYRTFIWNEDGAFNQLTAVWRAANPMPSLGAFGVDGAAGTNYLRRPRPVGPCFIFDEATCKARTIPAFVQLGVEDGGTVDATSWMKIPVTILPDRAGFRITRPTLSDWFPYKGKHIPEALVTAYGNLSYLTLLYNTVASQGSLRLALRLVGSIECDDAINEHAARQIGSPWPFAAEQVVFQPSRFKYRQLAAGSDLGLTGQHDTADDSAAAQLYAQRVRSAGEHALGHGSIVMRGINRSYHPGLGVAGTSGRNFSFAVDGADREYHPIIISVDWNFAEGVNKTELVLDTPAMGLPK